MPERDVLLKQLANCHSGQYEERAFGGVCSSGASIILTQKFVNIHRVLDLEKILLIELTS